jgi:LacI family transcriptional regulator/LacI family fructose operon transcriptional repressor
MDSASGSTKEPTMEDVARLAKVHQTTVSRVFRHDTSISEKTARRVRDVADRLGYRPNPLLSALSSLRKRRASLAHQAALAYVLRNETMDAHIPGVKQAAASRGYRAETFILGDELSPKRLNQILLARGIYGVIIGPLPDAHESFSLEWENFCTVAIEYSFEKPAFDRVVTDSFESMNMAIEQCRLRGYTGLGVVLATVVDDRNEGLLSAAYALARERDRSLRNIPSLIIEDWDAGKFSRWLKRHKPQVIISSNLLLPQITRYLASEGIKTPGDIGIVNLNLSRKNDSVSGICQDSPAIGAAAARLLIEKLNHNERGIPSSRQTLITEPHWVEGSTLTSL